MSTLLQDLRYSRRSLARRPGFSALCVAVLALGVGAAATLSSVVERVLLEPLGYPHEDRLYTVVSVSPQQGESDGGLFAPDFWELRERVDALEEMAFYGWRAQTLDEPGHVQQLRAVAASGNLFELLGIEPLLGRVLSASDEGPSWGDVTVISEAFWRRVYSADPGIVGRPVSLNGRTVTVVGVVPSTAPLLPAERADLWIPVGHFEDYDRSPFAREERDFVVLGRLAEEASPQQAQEELERAALTLAERFPASNDGWSLAMRPIHEWIVGEAGGALWVSLAAVGLLFLIALVNLAALLTLRLLGRREELAVRRALGASDRELFRQVVLESLVLSSMGLVLGGGVALVLERAIEGLASGVLPRSAALGLDYGVFGLIGVLTLAAVGLVGGGSALATLRGELGVARSRGGVGARTSERARRVLVGVEVALALTLLVAAGILARTLQELSRVDPGFAIEGTYSAHVLLDPSRYGPWPKRQEFFRAAVEQIRAVPGIESAGLTTTPPVPGLGIRIDSTYRGADGPAVDEPRAPRAALGIIGPGYLDTLRIPLLAGRDLNERDDLDHPRVALVNRTLAERAWPGEEAVGQRLEIFYEERMVLEVVGVVGDTRAQGLHLPPEPAFYLAYEQLPFMGTAIAVRSALPSAAVEESVRAAVLAVDPSQPVMRFDALSDELSDSVARERFFGLLLAVFASVAWLLAGAGVYGVFSHWVLRRRREIGLRLALGSTRLGVLGWLGRVGFVTLVPGLVAGALGGGLLGTALSRAFAAVPGVSPLVVGGATLLLGASAVVACLLPAALASRMSPAVALDAD